MEKLSFSIQEKWKSVGSRYKFQHNVPVPPLVCLTTLSALRLEHKQCLTDTEIRPLITTSATEVLKDVMSTKRFECFSAWSTLMTAVVRLFHIACLFAQPTPDNACHGCTGPTEEELEKAKTFMIKSVQHECFLKELNCIARGQNLPSQSSLRKLRPVVDSSGLLRVGGRIAQSELGMDETNPIIIPG